MLGTGDSPDTLVSPRDTLSDTLSAIAVRSEASEPSPRQPLRAALCPAGAAPSPRPLAREAGRRQRCY